jgi:hypothetical protein
MTSLVLGLAPAVPRVSVAEPAVDLVQESVAPTRRGCICLARRGLIRDGVASRIVEVAAYKAIIDYPKLRRDQPVTRFDGIIGALDVGVVTPEDPATRAAVICARLIVVGVTLDPRSLCGAANAPLVGAQLQSGVAPAPTLTALVAGFWPPAPAVQHAAREGPVNAVGRRRGAPDVGVTPEPATAFARGPVSRRR